APAPPASAPPAPAAPLRYGGFWVRFVAFILDGIVIAVITGALAPLFGFPIIETSTTAGAGGVQVNYTGSALSSLFGLVYFVGFWAFRGQTPGQIPFRMRVVRVSDGTRPDVVIALLRYVGLIISFAVLLLGVIWVAFDGRKQGWHDKIASTLVVRDPA
ncbi:MAG TPA: RDD family protein, partial [Candidatus Limnocylindria bacterium]